MGRVRGVAWLRARVSAVGARIGRRGGSLLLVSVLDAAIAFGLTDVPAATASQPAYRLIASIMPLAWWAVPWAAGAVLCVLQAFVRQDRIAFAVSTGLLWMWSLVFLAAWLVNDVPRGWLGAAAYGAAGAFLTLVSTWSEPPRRARPGGDGR